MKKILSILFLFPICVFTQTFEYDVLFEGIGDNREYFSEIATPQTILGTRGAFETGLVIDEHSLKIGASKLYEFGSALNDQPTKLVLYYQFKNNNKEFVMGSFERRERLNFPLAMLSDTLLYYRPLIEGLFTSLNWDWGTQDIFVDWTKRQTDSIRENFTVGFAGKLGKNRLFIDHYFILYHDAKPRIQTPDAHIKDYMGFAIMAGLNSKDGANISGYTKLGILSSYYRERNVTNGFIIGNSFYAELYRKRKNLAIKATLSTGASHIFAQGDRFYNAKDYLRTDLIWYFINHENVKGIFNYSFHLLNWNDIDQQQQLSIIYKFGGTKTVKGKQ